MTPPPPVSLPRELALLLLLSTLWGASYTFIRVGVETIPPITFILGRTLIAGTVLLAVIRWKGLFLPRDLATWKKFAIQASLNTVIPFTLIAWAEKSTEAGLTTILASTTPIFAFLLTVSITRHEAVTGRKVFGVLAGMAGICLIVGMEALSGLGQEVWAQLAIVTGSLFYGAAAIFGKNFRGLHPLMPAAGSMIIGSAMLAPFSLVVDRPWTIMPSLPSVLAMIALAVFSTALAFAVYFRLLQTLGTLGATAQAYLRVPIGVGLGVLFLGESLSSTAWLGLVCVMSGVVAMTLPSRKAVTA